MLNELIHSTQRFNTLIPLFRDGQQCKPALLFVWSRITAPAELSTRYTTADIVLEIGSATATVE